MAERSQVSIQKPEDKRENRTYQVQKKGRFRSISSSMEQILFLQRTIGNQAVGRLIKSGALQAKLRIGQPHDIYEQEADRVAEQVMAAPAHQAVSSALPHIQLFSGQSNVQMDSAPTSVDHALASPGRPLEPELRQDMEQRFGYDFTKVRVHTGLSAEQSARELNAQAYTVRHDIVFNTDKFVPGKHEGRRLLAHELMHMVQQLYSGVDRVQRQPQGSKRLPPEPGEYTPKEYEAWLKAHPKREYRIGGPWEPDALYARYTPKWFWDHGYVYAGRGGNIPWYWFEIWISDSDGGKEFRVWRTSYAGAKTAPGATPPRQGQAPQKPPIGPDHLDPNADRENLFGPIIAAREDVDIAFGEGDVVLYEDGTVELFLKGTTQSYVFRPVPGGGYVVYDPDGRRLDKIWMIPEDDIPDPITDAVE